MCHTRPLSLQSPYLVRDALLIALRGAWCFVKIFNVDFIEKEK